MHNGVCGTARYSVLVVTNLWPYPGDHSYGGFVEEQVRSLRALGVECDVLFVNGRLTQWNYLRGIRQLQQRLQSRAYDLVHAHFGLSGLVARFEVKLPLVVTFHGDDVLGRPRRDGSITPTGRFFQVSSFLLARMVSAVIVQSRQMKKVLRLKSAEIIPCGIDLDLFHPMERADARRSIGLDPRKKYVLAPYNPAEPRKRFDLIEDAVARSRQQMPEIELLPVCGKAHAEMPRYMNAADVIVMASMIEGSPNVVKEALACNLPVVTVDVGDTAELLEGTEGNHLVPRDAGAIATSIVEVCRRGARARSRERIAELSIERVAERVLQVYRHAIRSDVMPPSRR